MKCPYCAEEILPDASVCRHCQRRIPRGIEGLDQIGSRYVLGRATGDQWAVWEYASGTPIAYHPRTDEGWQAAWRSFRAYEAQGTGTAPSGSNGMATAGLILGVIGAAVGLIPLLSSVAFICGLLAVIFGGVGMSRAKQTGVGRGQAIAGLVLGVVAIGLSIIGFVILNRAVEEIDRIFESPS